MEDSDPLNNNNQAEDAYCILKIPILLFIYSLINGRNGHEGQ